MTGQRVAIVAGAGAAGAATAASLADQGLMVVVLDSREEAAAAAIAPLLAAGHAAESHGVDLLDSQAVTDLRDDLLGRLGRVDVLVHLVGGWRGSATLDLASVANWQALNPPIVGTLATLTAVFADAVRTTEGGRVFMVTSTTAAHPTAGNIAYAAAKSAAETWMGGVAHYFRDSTAASVTIAVKALLTEGMVAQDPQKEWPGYTHVEALGRAIATLTVSPVANGSRVDLTTEEYSGS